jgi:hypothetical protein
MCRLRPAGGTAAWEWCTSPFTGTAGADGDYVYEVSGGDDVGNEATASRTITLDTTAPALAFTDGPAEGASVATRSVTVRFAASDLHLTKTVCRLDAGAEAPCTAGDSEALSGLTDGAHTLTVRAVDAAGNATERTRTFAVAVPKTDGGTPSTNGGGATSGSGGGGTGGSGGTGTAGGSSAGGTGGTTGGSGGVLTPATVPGVLKLGSSRHGARTVLTRLKLVGLPAGAKVAVTCTGGGCPFAKTSAAARGGTADLTQRFARRALKAGAVIRLTLAAPGFATRVITIAIRKGKAPRVTSA